MTKPTGKKRGRPRKVPEFMARLGEDQNKWNKWLTFMGLPEHSSSKKEVLEHRLPDGLENGKPVRPILGNRLEDQSITQPSDSWYALLVMDDEDEPLPAWLRVAWRNYLESMYVIAEELSPNDKGGELKRLILEDARSRRSEPPPAVPDEIGTPAEFKKRLADHEMKIRCSDSRHEQLIIIRVCPLSQHAQESMDPSENPKHHWEWLTWISY